MTIDISYHQSISVCFVFILPLAFQIVFNVKMLFIIDEKSIGGYFGNKTYHSICFL